MDAADRLAQALDEADVLPVWSPRDDDTWRQVGLQFSGDELAPDVEDGWLLIFDIGLCPWPGGQVAEPPPIVWAACSLSDHLVRWMEPAPPGWALTCNDLPPIPVDADVLILGTAVQVLGPKEPVPPAPPFPRPPEPEPAA